MYPLIGLYVSFPFIRKMYMALNRREMCIFVAIFVFVSGVFPLLHSLLFKWSFTPSNAWGLMIFSNFIGFAFVGFIMHNLCMKRWIAICLYITSSYLYILETSFVAMYNGKYFEDSYNLITMVQAISIFMMFKDFKGKIPYFISDISKFSFGIYLVHMLILPYVNKILLLCDSMLHPVLIVILSVCLTLVCSYFLIKACSNVPYLRRLVN